MLNNIVYILIILILLFSSNGSFNRGGLCMLLFSILGIFFCSRGDSCSNILTTATTTV